MCQITSGATGHGSGQGWKDLVSTLPLKNYTQADLPETHRGPFPWYGLPPWEWQVPTTIPRGAVQVWVNVPNHVWSHWLKNEVWLICSKLTGDLSHDRGCLPWRWQVPTTIPWEAVQVWVNVPNHIRSHQLKNEDWPISSKLTGDLPHHEGNIPWRQQVHT